jgi:hypothetical protein
MAKSISLRLSEEPPFTISKSSGLKSTQQSRPASAEALFIFTPLIKSFFFAAAYINVYELVPAAGIYQSPDGSRVRAVAYYVLVVLVLKERAPER